MPHETELLKLFTLLILFEGFFFWRLIWSIEIQNFRIRKWKPYFSGIISLESISRRLTLTFFSMKPKFQSLGQKSQLLSPRQKQTLEANEAERCRCVRIAEYLRHSLLHYDVFPGIVFRRWGFLLQSRHRRRRRRQSPRRRKMLTTYLRWNRTDEVECGRTSIDVRVCLLMLLRRQWNSTLPRFVYRCQSYD